MTNILNKSLIIFISALTTFNVYANLPENISELVDGSAPAVVNITAKKEVSQRSSFGYGGIPDEMLERFGIPREFREREMPQQKREATSYGSGFILKENYIMTNFHVVEDATEVVISLSDRREYVAEVVGVDPLSDLAVLKVQGKDLPTVNVGNSDDLKVGDWVVAIGSPFSFDFSVTAGIVSAKGRSIQNNNIGNYVPFLQTDVAINPGNSGGPLFNLDGEVVGINSQIYSRSGGYQGLAFAIPINVATDVAEQIINNGEVLRGYLGVRMSEVDSDLADALGMKKPYGALINDVEEGESADLAGLVPGDVIIEFDDKEIKFSSDLPHVVGQIKPNTKASARVVRDGDEINLDFILGELPVNNESFVPAKTQSSSDPLGLKVADIDRDNPSMANMPDGVIVSRVNPNSAASGKINRGDLITMIQYKGKKYEVSDVESFTEALENFSSGNKIAIHLIRGGNRIITSITLT
ncbi:MAG: Do family serine endopeptidase [Gammaproteobacteria bacterium]